MKFFIPYRIYCEEDNLPDDHDDSKDPRFFATFREVLHVTLIDLGEGRQSQEECIWPCRRSNILFCKFKKKKKYFMVLFRGLS